MQAICENMYILPEYGVLQLICLNCTFIWVARIYFIFLLEPAWLNKCKCWRTTSLIWQCEISHTCHAACWSNPQMGLANCGLMYLTSLEE